ncbi:hypothetical protein CJ739_2331 [Mariniflexile rhizosphaerae]|uniref:hypothetical protein n=1 Tax=unclassified Mariniflexile TaxID=2643887 RepID=UPI000CC22A33|nr:hypothetical protein [Mariniflexile sp. TRM1-10]AXP81405.1 hypothetical protein CJ739_2331 [Mariniflexile sp. TRM1-10]PLB18495.1 MAG: hypothetical protein TRG1_2648 [Flavobacteriaceae bacterium FS1-H7996/R]
MKKLILTFVIGHFLLGCGISEEKYEALKKENKELKTEVSRLNNLLFDLQLKESLRNQFSEEDVCGLTKQYLEKEYDFCIEYVVFDKIIAEKLTNGNWYVYVSFTDKSGGVKFKDEFFNKKSTNKYLFKTGENRSYNIELIKGTIPFCS